MSLRGFRPGSALALLCLSLLVLGCGSEGPHVVKVTGTVTRGGKPVERLVVNFWPQKGRPSWGVTDKEGHYTLNYERNRDGAVVGPHKVWVEIRPSSPKEEADLRNGRIKLHPETNAILQKYGKDSTPLQKVAVKDEDPQVIDLKLD
jgi:hypothetical protein